MRKKSRGKKGTPRSDLTPRQERFCIEYCRDSNGTQAAIRAGYKEHAADAQASTLLTLPKVRNRLDELYAEVMRSAGIDAGRVIREIARIAFFSLKSAADWSADHVTLRDSKELSDDDAAAISEVSILRTKYGDTVRIKAHDKPRALELLGKHLKLFTEKTEVSGPGGGPVRVEYDYSKLTTCELQTLLALATRIEIANRHGD